MSQLSIHQKEHKIKRRNRLLLRVGLVFLAILIIFFTLVFVSRLQKFRITEVDLSGQTLVSPDDVVSATNSFISGYYLGLFPRNDAFIYPKSELENFLKENFKRINTIQIKLVGFKKMEIVITERQQQALWCDGSGVPSGNASTTASSDSEKCYFLDDNGMIFSEAPNFSGDAYFKYYGGVSSSSPVIGQTYMASSSLFAEIGSFVQTVEGTSIEPVSVLVTPDGQFTLNLSSGGKIYFIQSQSFADSASNLKTLLQNLSSSSSTSVLNIDYIDLRFGNKLYYKMK